MSNQRPARGAAPRRPSPLPFLIGAVILILAALLGFFLMGPAQFFRSYLLGWLYWTGIGIGGLGLTALHLLTGGQWGMVTRRIFEAASRTLPLMGLLFIPLFFGLASIYSWADPAKVAGDALLQHKEPYLNVPFFIGRTILYFLVWTFIAYRFSQFSVQIEEGAPYEEVRRIKLFAAVSMVLLVITVTFAGIDWLMTLEPHWFSSIFGGIIIMSFVLAAWAFGILTVLRQRATEAFRHVVGAPIFSDLGSLLMAFVMIWSYVQLSQLLIIWSANIPEEATWYLHRMKGGWQWIGWSLLVLHFAVPFVTMMSQTVRSNPRWLRLVALLIMVMYFVHLVWQIVPTWHESITLSPFDLLITIGMGALWIGLFLWQYGQAKLIPPVAIPELRQRIEHAH